ncbi:MAG: 4Fe-4S binding protein [Candidatus Aenigmatarchaeota archaeon]|nr:4Fe-4S binding protein [Candidatus Aenigmarchaeota archaeon]
MAWTLDKNKCLRCGGCVAVCPVGALELHVHPEIDTKKCVLCGTCAKACPVSAITVKK